MLNVKLNNVNENYTILKGENAVILGTKFLTP